MPCRGARATREKSAMKADSLWIDENRVADFNFDIAVANWIEGANAFTDALRTIQQQAKTDPVAKCRREGDRGHIALVVIADRGGAARQKMRAGPYPPVAVDGFEADEARPIRGPQCGTFRHHPADEVLAR